MRSRHQAGKKPTVLVATAPKELHAIGAKTVTKMLEFYGFKALYLGADLESDEIIGTISETMPHAVVLSATLEVHIVELKALIKTLRNPPFSYRGVIIAGGNAFKNLENAEELLGADAVCQNFETLLTILNSQ